MTTNDPLAPPPNANPAVTWLINVLFQLDCFVACVFTGQREKTISCWLGECEDGYFGPWWRWGMLWLWWPVNWFALHVFGQDRHCESSIGPFLVEEDKP